MLSPIKNTPRQIISNPQPCPRIGEGGGGGGGEIDRKRCIMFTDWRRDCANMSSARELLGSFNI